MHQTLEPAVKSPSGILASGLERSAATGYLMVESFTIRNYKSFNDVKVEGCRRINIIVGDNGSGKTGLLEALFLAAGVSPEIILRTRSWRGFDVGRMQGSEEELHEELWGELFHKFQWKQSAVISLKGTGEQTRSVSIKLNRRGQMKVVAPSRIRPGAPVRVVPETSPIEFKWNIQGFSPVKVQPFFEEGKLKFPPTPDSHVRASFFAANQTASATEAVRRFSKLSRSFLDLPFSDKFNLHFPNVTNLSVEVGAGTPMIFAAVEGLPQKIPLSLASGGMMKLASILLGITDQPKGIILVDELENGFYYERLPLIWETLLDFAREYECQLFVSSHSAECLNAAAALAEKNSAEFCMLRTVREGGGTAVRRFDGERFASAVLSNIEIR